MEIYEKIRMIRLEKSLTQQVLADAISCDVTVVSNIERGVRPIRYDEVEKIARAMKMSMVDLVGYPKRYVEQNGQDEVQAILQIKLSKSKRDEVLKQVLGDIDILDSL